MSFIFSLKNESVAPPCAANACARLCNLCAQNVVGNVLVSLGRYLKNIITAFLYVINKLWSFLLLSPQQD